MASNTAVSLAGELKFVSNRRSLPITLMQSIAGLEAKSVELTIPHNGVSPTTLPLNLSAGVTEALFLHVYSPATLRMFVTPTGGTEHAFGIKGHQILTFAPGGGLTALRFQNASDTEDVTVEVTVGAKAQVTDIDPTFWT